MPLPGYDFSLYAEPLRTILLGNEAAWQLFLSVTGDLSAPELEYNYPGLVQRSIMAMIDHALNFQYRFYTMTVVLGETKALPSLMLKLSSTPKEVETVMCDTYDLMVNIWMTFKPIDLSKRIETPWGPTQTTAEILFRSILHTQYHVSEIAFLRGLGGFPSPAVG